MISRGAGSDADCRIFCLDVNGDEHITLDLR